MTEQVAASLQEFVKQSPEQIQDFIKQAWSQEKFNWWLGVAESATLNTFQHSGKVHLEWARVAIMVYERLAMASSGKSVDLMRFKARLIQSLGNIQPIPLATVDEIVQWFFDNLPFSYEETLQKLTIAQTGLKNLPIDDMRELRQIKKRLNVLNLISNLVVQDEEITRWLEIRERLP